MVDSHSQEPRALRRINQQKVMGVVSAVCHLHGVLQHSSTSLPASALCKLLCTICRGVRLVVAEPGTGLQSAQAQSSSTHAEASTYVLQSQCLEQHQQRHKGVRTNETYKTPCCPHHSCCKLKLPNESAVACLPAPSSLIQPARACSHHLACCRFVTPPAAGGAASQRRARLKIEPHEGTAGPESPTLVVVIWASAPWRRRPTKADSSPGLGDRLGQLQINSVTRLRAR